MKKAVFLDRDGVINKEVDNLRRIKDLRLLPGVAKAISQLNRLGYLTIIITNQPVIARGWIKPGYLDEIHQELQNRLKPAKIDAVYYCPHHPNANLKEYRKKCSCRKPNTGMVKKAIQKYKIDPKKSFFIGDSTRDILTGEKVGVKTILVQTGYSGKDGSYKVMPDFVSKNLLDSIKIIKKYG